MENASWGSFQPGGNGGVPTSAPAQQQPDVSDLIRNIITPIDPNLIKAASTPITGSHTGAVPTSLQRPVTPHQDTPYDTRRVVGAGNARARGIGNAITGVTNAIGNFVTKQAQVKQDVLKDQATKVITAQQAIDDAQQQYDMAKASPDGTPGKAEAMEKFKGIVDQNTQTRDSIFADKHGKDLAKGFDISYTDPESNKTEYHAAVQAAIKDVKTNQEKKAAIQKLQQQMATQRGQNAGAAYAKAQPQGLAGNSVAQAQLSTALQQQKDQVESARALAPVWAEQIRAGAQLSVEDRRGQVDLRVHAMDFQKEMDKQLLINQQHDKDNTAARSLEYLKASLKKVTDAADAGNPDNIMKNFQTALSDYGKITSENQQRRQALNDELDKAKGGSGREVEIRRQLVALDGQDELYKNGFTTARNYAAKRAGLDVNQMQISVPTVHVGDGASDASSTGAASSHGDSADLDPRSGKAWKSSVSTADKLLIKSYYGASSLGSRAAGIVGTVNKDFNQFTRALDNTGQGKD